MKIYRHNFGLGKKARRPHKANCAWEMNFARSFRLCTRSDADVCLQAAKSLTKTKLSLGLNGKTRRRFPCRGSLVICAQVFTWFWHGKASALQIRLQPGARRGLRSVTLNYLASFSNLPPSFLKLKPVPCEYVKTPVEASLR